jgi:hypothetical protein
MRIPIATSTSRPVISNAGELRFNVDTHELETFDGKQWRVIGESSNMKSTKPWKKWFAWRPVKVKGHWVWWKTVYRYKTNTYVNYDDWANYEYGDIFDVLKNEN